MRAIDAITSAQDRLEQKRLVCCSSREAVVRSCPRNLPAFRLLGRGVFWSPAPSARPRD